MLIKIFMILFLGQFLFSNAFAHGDHQNSRNHSSLDATNKVENNRLRLGMFSMEEREFLKKYLQETRPNQLSNGLNKIFVRGKILDEQAFAMSKELPKNVSSYFSSFPSGTTLRQIGDSIVKVERNGVILDVIHR